MLPCNDPTTHDYSYLIDPEGLSETQGGRKDDGRESGNLKLRYDLLPVKAIREVVKVLTFGANKYGDRNWEKGLAWSRPYAALHRHMSSFWEGEDLDSESGIPHIAHAICSLLFLMEYTFTRLEFDDRPI